MNYPRIDVEPLFDEMVREYPMACVLKDKMPNPAFPNADYLFHHEKVVAELKRIQDDNFDSANNRSKLTAAIGKYHSEGKISSKEISEENWRTLPIELQETIYDITTHSIRGRITKANKQIRATKEKLGLKAYKGVLIIVNDGVLSYPPSVFIHAAFRLIHKNFSEITFFIFFTAKIFAKTREFPMPMQFWVGIDMEKAGKQDAQLSNDLHKSWKAIVNKKTGISALNVEMNDIEGFWKAKNLPK